MTDNENKSIEEEIKENLDGETSNLKEDVKPESDEISSNEEQEENIDAVKEELVLTKDRLLRSLADNENIRKQMDKSKVESIKYGVQPLARELLTVMDNFERALPPSDDKKSEPILEGFYLIKKEIKSILEKFNIKKISALGDDFDANYHQAMFEKETTDYKPKQVCEIIQDGYIFHERLLRPALVAVAKESSQEKNENFTKEEIEKDQDVKNTENKKDSSEVEKNFE